MKNKKTIFEVLFEKEICFAVYVSLNTFNGKGIDENSRDYFLIVQKQDLKELKNMNFKKTDDYVNVYERDLSVSEIAEFKTYMDKFVKVQHNKFGRVYELKNNSFKKLHESIVCALIKKLRMFFRISNAAFEFYNSTQLSFSGHIEPSKLHQLHKLALAEIERENPDLSLIEFYNSIQLSFSGHIAPSKMHQLHKLALVEIEKETPDLSLIYNLLAEMEKLDKKQKNVEQAKAMASLAKQANNILVTQLDASKFLNNVKDAKTYLDEVGAMSSSRLNSNNFKLYTNAKRRNKSSK